MKAIYNSRVFSTESIPLDIRNRAFCYGDGLFETIVTGAKRINLTPQHVDRLNRGCEVLGMSKMAFSGEKLHEMIESLAEENNILGSVRSRLKVWRNEGGLYAPHSSSYSFLLECVSNEAPFYKQLKTVGISAKIQVHKYPLSFAKTMSALPYVLAGRERIQAGWDEIILCDQHGHIAETGIANIFWVKNGEFFTPALETGCIQGVMRDYLISEFEAIGKKVHQVLQSKEVVLNADAVFTSNASGIGWIKELESSLYENPATLFPESIKQQLVL